MIVKIKNGVVTVEKYGFSPGKYSLSEFSTEDLQIEQRVRFAYCLKHPEECDLLLDAQIARAIDNKCNEICDE